MPHSPAACLFRFLLAGCVGLAFLPAPARAADGEQACTNLITSVPATISTPGTWCLGQDVAFAPNVVGNGVQIDADDVVLDCNGLRIEGNINSNAVGIRATNRRNVTIRRCRVVGFNEGIRLEQSGVGISEGHLVEDNLATRANETSIYVAGNQSVIRRNRVVNSNAPDKFNTGNQAIWTVGNVDVIDNVINGVYNQGVFAGNTTAIFADANITGSIRGNRIENVERLGLAGTGTGYGIRLYNPGRVIVRDNVLVGTRTDDDDSHYFAIHCQKTTGEPVPTVRAKDNRIFGIATAVFGCSNDGNTIRP